MASHDSVGKAADDLLSQVEARLQVLQVQRAATKKEMRRVLRPVMTTARRLVPQPGYPGDKPGLTPLRNTITTTIRDYQRNTIYYGLVQADYRKGGQHGHLVEGWFKTAEHMRGSTTLFVLAAFDQHKQKIAGELSNYIAKEYSDEFKKSA